MTATAAGVGSLGTDPDSEWYHSIEKPPWQPPAVAFPLVWAPLYVAIAYGTGRMVDKGRPEERPALLALTAIDLVANAGHTGVRQAMLTAATRSGGYGGGVL